MLKKIVRENMSQDLITIGWNERIETAYRRMAHERVRHLPVTTESGEVVGMLSDRDVQRAMISTIQTNSAHSFTTETIQFDPESRVRDYMSWPVKAIDQDTDLRLVAQRLIQEKVSSLLVQEGPKVVGIVTADDLLRVLIELLADPKASDRFDLRSILKSGLARLDSTAV